MIYLKTSPVGLDVQIQKLQQHLYDKLGALWSCDIDAYGRVYKDNDKDSTKPRYYNNNGEYKELLTNDSVKGVHFFFIENDETSNLPDVHLYSSNVDLIVIVDDIRTVKPNVNHYADEEIKEDVRNNIRKGFTINSVVKGDSALDGFDISKLHFVYPYFVFKIAMTINYKSIKCNV